MATASKCSRNRRITPFPFAALPAPPATPARSEYPPPPDEAQCFELWHKYDMLENVCQHSLMVANIATALATRASDLGMEIDIQACRAAGLLHDIAKTWCIQNGGSHASIGASWTVQETGHYGIAQGVMLHVHWPWDLPNGKAICCLPIFIIYADKRVKHDRCVTLQERFSDLIKRYGKTETARENIRQSCRQADEIQAALSSQLEWRLNEYSFDCRRLVQ